MTRGQDAGSSSYCKAQSMFVAAVAAVEVDALGELLWYGGPDAWIKNVLIQKAHIPSVAEWKRVLLVAVDRFSLSEEPVSGGV